MNRMMIHTKSKELEIPFSHVLAGYLLETLVELIAQSGCGRDLWMLGERQAGLDRYKRSAPQKVSYVYTGESEAAAFCGVLAEELQKGLAQKKIGTAEKQIRQKDGGEWVVHFAFSIEEMYVPFDIEMFQVKREHLFAQDATLRLFMENNRTVSYPVYPAEQSIAYDLAEILRQLELLNEMERYDGAYHILRRYPLEGRKVKDALMKLCESSHVSLTPEPYDLWKSYGDYTYMRKKWKVFLRKEHRNGPQWEEVHHLIDVFLEPVWRSVVEGNVFFGDWMPELERFLD